MEIDKKALPTKLLWVDLEMTGLDPISDVILEVAVEVTDFKLQKLASYEAVVQQPLDIIEARMQQNSWWQQYPESREAILSGMAAGKPSYDVERELMALVEQHFQGEPAILAGNSIHNDRNFIRRWWPELDAKLHYRMLDVSAWKVWMQGAYGVEAEKRGAHRAYDDIQESMSELQYYLKWFQEQPTAQRSEVEA